MTVPPSGSEAFCRQFGVSGIRALVDSHARASVVQFSRSAGGPGVGRGPGLGEEVVRRIAEGIVGIAGDSHHGAVPLIVVGTAEQLPQPIREHMAANGIPPEEIRGVHLAGSSYLVADKLSNRMEVEETVFHEHYTHGGLRAKYGTQLGEVMINLVKRTGGLEGIRKLAKDQRIDLSHYEATILDNPRIQERFQVPLLMEELLGHMSATTGTLRRTIEEYVGGMRAWLRANRFAELAEYGVTDLAHVLRQARDAIQGKAVSDPGAPMYLRVSPSLQQRVEHSAVEEEDDDRPAFRF